jgi:hypothetical protein
MARQISGRVDLTVLRDFDDLPEFYANNIALCRSRYRTFGSLPIWISMAHNIDMEATHMIDRYFALAGICTGQPSDFVNYSKTLEEVATQVGLLTLLSSPDYPMPDGLDRWADRPSLRLRSQQVRIPSWIPDGNWYNGPPLKLSLVLRKQLTYIKLPLTLLLNKKIDV